MHSSSQSVLAIGDSLIAGYGLPLADSFPSQLELALRHRCPATRVVNAGVSGDTTTDVLRRLPRVMTRLDAEPDLVILQVGPNDVIQRVPAAQTRAQVNAILVELRRSGTPVLLTTVDPPAFLRQRASEYLPIHRELAALHGATLHSFFPAGVLGHVDMVLADRVHPNAKAIRAVVSALLPTVESILDGTAARAGAAG